MSVADHLRAESRGVALVPAWAASSRDVAAITVAAGPLVLLAVVAIPYGRDGWLVLLPLAVLSAVGALLVGRRKSATVGGLVLAVAVFSELALAGGAAARSAETPPGWVPWWAWLGTWGWWPAAAAAV